MMMMLELGVHSISKLAGIQPLIAWLWVSQGYSNNNKHATGANTKLHRLKHKGGNVQQTFHFVSKTDQLPALSSSCVPNQWFSEEGSAHVKHIDREEIMLRD